MTVERISGIVDTSRTERARIAVIGLGSFGAPVVEYLARHEVGIEGDWLLADGDDVEKTNTIAVYTEEDVGKPKVEAMASLMARIRTEYTHVKTWRKRVRREDIPSIVSLAPELDVLCLFADDHEVMNEIQTACYELCPIVRGMFGEHCDVAQLAFSYPGQTSPLSRTLGQERQRGIDSPQALGFDTTIVSLLAGKLCMSLLLRDGKGSEFMLPCYKNAPLFLIGLRRVWIFSTLPEDIVMSVVLAGS
jgi:hypothetical protein